MHGLRRQVAFAWCVLHAALLLSCAKTPPRTAPAVPAPAAVVAPVSPLQKLRDDVAAITSTPGVQRGTWGIVVHSLDRNERLFELNPRTLLVPASIVKLLSVATAAEAVGWDFRFTTTLAVNGTIANGVLSGDLVVYGNGDPSLGGRGGDAIDVLIDGIRAAGITRITGRIIGDDNALEDARPAFAWAWDDLGYPSGALFGALNYAENRTAIWVTPGTAANDRGALRVEPVAEGRPLTNHTRTLPPGGQQLIWPEQRPGETALTVTGTIPLGAGAARVNVSAGNPTFWFANALRNRLLSAGIAVDGAAVDIDDIDAPAGSPSTIFTYHSPTLADLARPMLKESINLYAEAAMRLNVPTTAVPKTQDGALDAFKARVTGWGISPEAFQIVDGSGLSRRDAVAPEVFLAVLQRMYDPATASPWMRALPIAGVDGSLQGRMQGTPAQTVVRAKTGSMSNIRSLAGYATTADGEHLAFVIMLNDFEGTPIAGSQAVDAIAVRLASFTR